MSSRFLITGVNTMFIAPVAPSVTGRKPPLPIRRPTDEMVTKNGHCRSDRRLPLCSSARPLRSLSRLCLDLIFLDDAVPDLHPKPAPGGWIDSSGLETTQLRKGCGQVLSGLCVQLHAVNAHSDLTALPLDGKLLGPGPEVHLLPIGQSVRDAHENVIRLGEEGIVRLLGGKTSELHPLDPRGEFRRHIRGGGHRCLMDLHLAGLVRLRTISVLVAVWTIFSPSGSDFFAQPPGPLLWRRSVLQLAGKALAESLDVMPAQTLGDRRRDRLRGALGGKTHRDEIGGDLDPLIEKGHGSLSRSGAGDVSRELLH